ncbi:MAG: transglutaminase family protein [Paracoccaceae bacterium]
MILIVEHQTIYRYAMPVRAVVHSHRLTPARHEGQRVIDWQVQVSDGIPGAGFRDGAGDWVQGWSVRGPVSEIAVRVAGSVETKDTAGILRGLRESVPPEAWLRETALTAADDALAALSAGALAGAVDPLDRAHRLSKAVSDAIAYDKDATHAATTAAEALALGAGVCQDHAHALIAAARVADIPARYVTGYLYTKADDHGEAAHAWAELHVQGLGWVGFDPANFCCPNENYIRIGCGLDAVAAAPIRGRSRGQGEGSLDVTVAVQSVQQ